MTSTHSLAKTQALTKLTPAERTALVLRVNRNTRQDVATQADKDKTAAVAGRWQNHKDV